MSPVEKVRSPDCTQRTGNFGRRPMIAIQHLLFFDTFHCRKDPALLYASREAIAEFSFLSNTSRFPICQWRGRFNGPACPIPPLYC